MSRIYIVTDMEGVAGINSWYECRPEPDGRTPDYERSRLLLSREIAAAVEGAKEAGAREIVVLDGHRGGGNFIAEELPQGARYVMGRGKRRPLAGLDGKFDGVILLAYHPMARTPCGLLAHTMSAATWKRFSVNGIPLGEIGMMAMISGGRGVPVWLVTGSRAACDEAQALLGNKLRTVAVKDDLAQESSITVAPAESRVLIRKAVTAVVAEPPAVEPFEIEHPLVARIEFESKAIADEQSIPACYRLDDETFEAKISSSDMLSPRYWV